jgi:thiamine pyrophosphate-dependent acetolactate synthase large subunit-like protein
VHHQLACVTQAKADLVVVMGTSLQVAPLSKLIPGLPQGVTKVLINREAVRSRVAFDLELLGDCDAICRQVMQQLWPGDANSSSVETKSETQSVGATKGTPSSDGASSDATRAKRRRCGEHGR